VGRLSSVPRPRLDEAKKKIDAVQLRLNAEDRIIFDRLSAAVGANELRGVEMSGARLLRWLFMRAAEERGLTAPAPTPKKRAAR
jgi:hypothetical protein